MCRANIPYLLKRFEYVIVNSLNDELETIGGGRLSRLISQTICLNVYSKIQIQFGV